MAKILVIDDDRAVRHIVRQALDELKLEIFDAPTVEQGLSLQREHKPDLVLLDIMLPEISGLEAFHKLHALDSKLPVIFMTAHNDIGVRKQAMAGGAIAFLCKPFGHELFVKAVSAALQSGSYRKTQ